MVDEIYNNDNMGELVLYRSDDGLNIQVRLHGETVWLNQKLMAELYGKDVRTINEHILNIYEERELLPEATIRKFRIVQIEGSRNVSREIDFYSLEMIIAVGYRVKSPQGTAFRQWATQRLHDYIVKGFALNDKRLKDPDAIRHFEELLQKIRDIRSSERMFWQKILDIFATSSDYDKNSNVVKTLFKTLQNKMHFAAHGNTSAEMIFARADASKHNMGLTNFQGDMLLQRDTEIAKNYLSGDELDTLNRIVMVALEFAELRTLNRQLITMQEWIFKIDELLSLSGQKILKGAGKISHDKALQKAHEEYDKYKLRISEEETEIEKHFIAETKKLKKPKDNKK